MCQWGQYTTTTQPAAPPVPVDEARKEALRLALDWAMSQDYLDEKITDTAARFEGFLRGEPTAK